jgi:hypothetical protein
LRSISKQNVVPWPVRRSRGMNYRRGFQRVYAVLTVAWVAGVLLVLPADRLNFWRQRNTDDHEGPVVDSVTWTGERKQEIDFTIRGRNFQPGSLVLIAQYTQAGGWKYLESLQPRSIETNELIVHYAGLPASEDMLIVERPDQRMSRPMPFLVAADEQPRSERLYEHIRLELTADSRLGRILWLLSLLMLLPAFGYTALFYLAPWVFRGFKTSRSRAARVRQTDLC